MVPATATTRFWHPFADMGSVSRAELVIERGEGVHVYDTEGNRYLDATASLWYANLGHSREEIAEAVAAQMRTLPAYSTFGDFGNKPSNDAVRAARPPGPDGRRARVPRLGRRRRDRHGGQDRSPPLVPARAARARAPDLSHARLPRHARVRHEHRRHRGQRDQLGPAGLRHLGGAVGLARGPRGRDPARGSRPRGGLLLRAGDRRRRRAAAARGLHPGRGGPVRRARRAAGDRQRDLRLRPARHVVRRRALGGCPAGPDHLRQGRDLRLPAAGRRGGLGLGRRPVLRRAGRADAPPRRDVRRPPDGLRRLARGARHLRAREHHPTRA